MALAIVVNGEAQVKVGTGGSGALEVLGVSVDGVTIKPRLFNDPVYTDTFGPKVAFDYQYFLEDAIITCDLVFYDQAVLEKLLARKTGGTAGVLASAGRLMGASGDFVRLLITSPIAGLPYNFLKAFFLDDQEVKLGTKRNIWRVTFQALPYTGAAGDTNGTVVWNRVAT